MRTLERLTASGTVALVLEREAPDLYRRIIAQALLAPSDTQAAVAGCRAAGHGAMAAGPPRLARSCPRRTDT